jgi:hypothetical protein
VCRFEVRDTDELAKALEAVANDLQCPGVTVEGLREVIEDDRFCACAVELFERMPNFRLRFANEGNELFRENRSLAVERLRIALNIPGFCQ